MAPKSKKPKVRVGTLKKDWTCPCGRPLKAGEQVVRVAGAQYCAYCYVRKAPVKFSLKGWSLNIPFIGKLGKLRKSPLDMVEGVTE